MNSRKRSYMKEIDCAAVKMQIWKTDGSRPGQSDRKLKLGEKGLKNVMIIEPINQIKPKKKKTKRVRGPLELAFQVFDMLNDKNHTDQVPRSHLLSLAPGWGRGELRRAQASNPQDVAVL